MANGSKLTRKLLAVVLVGCALSTYATAEPVTEAVEATVERAARRFRRRTYDQYRGNRLEYDRRVAAGNEVLLEWKRRGRHQHEAFKILTWFERSATGPMALPSFDASAGSTERTNSHVIHNPYSSNQSSTPPSTYPQESASSRNNIDYTVTPIEPPAIDPLSAPTGDMTPGTVEGLPLPERMPGPGESETLPPTDASMPRVANEQSQPELAGTSIAGLQIERPPLDLPEVEFNPIEDASPAVEELPVVKYRRQELESERRVVAVNRFEPVEAETITSVLSEETYQSPVDISVLRAKIRSYNVSVANLEHRLSDTRVWNVEELESVLERHVALAQQRDLILLYHQAIPQQDQQRIEPIATSAPVGALLAQRTFEARLQVESESPIEIERLDRITNAIKTKRD